MQNHSLIPSKIPCERCGGPLYIGRFAFGQKLCWGCYRDDLFEMYDLLPNGSKEKFKIAAFAAAQIYGEVIDFNGR